MTEDEWPYVPLPSERAAGPWGRAGRGEPGPGTGRGGDVTGLVTS
jgi:hypothetical protein